jgi:hypothetical protein
MPLSMECQGTRSTVADSLSSKLLLWSEVRLGLGVGVRTRVEVRMKGAQGQGGGEGERCRLLLADKKPTLGSHAKSMIFSLLLGSSRTSIGMSRSLRLKSSKPV